MSEGTVLDKVSVIMGAYNCARTLGEAIDSIIQQTYQNWELIIGDDGSEDDTYQIAESYRLKYPDRIILFRNEHNRKLAATLNSCLQLATGKYIARMDADDVSLPERLEKQVSFLQSHQDVVLVGTAIICRYQNSCQIRENSEYPDCTSIRSGVPFFHPTIMTYKAVYDKLGGYTSVPRTNRCEDIDLWFRFFLMGFKGANLKEPLYRYTARRHKGTIQDYWRSWVTVTAGYKKLGFPWYTFVKPTVKMVVRILMPEYMMHVFRQVRFMRKQRGNPAADDRIAYKD